MRSPTLFAHVNSTYLSFFHACAIRKAYFPDGIPAAVADESASKVKKGVPAAKIVLRYKSYVFGAPGGERHKFVQNE